MMAAEESNMKNPKTEALKMVEAMPDDIAWDSIVYRLFVRAKVEQGMADVEAGRVIAHDQMKKEIDAWRASRGPTTPVPTSD
jgi:predicted transcriptional regulator